MGSGTNFAPIPPRFAKCAPCDPSKERKRLGYNVVGAGFNLAARTYAPYRITKLAFACKRNCLVLARTCTVSRGGPQGGQRGKDFSPPKKARRLHCITPRMALDPLQRRPGLG